VDQQLLFRPQGFRKACIVVNGHTSPIVDLPQAGLPQGSPLSPILFLFFNADIVQHAIPSGGSVAFVDDYTAWVTGRSAEENTKIIQTVIIPMLEKWEIESGALFEPSKTQFTHFTRDKNNGRLSETAILFKRSKVAPAASVKILGVVMDQQLRYKLHGARAAKRGLIAATALRRLRGLLPKVARQLYIATVAPVIDYASPIWYPRARERVIKLLQPTQRIGAQAIINGFKTVSLSIAEAEADITPVRERLFRIQQRYYINLKTLPRTHPCNRGTSKMCKRFTSPLQTTAQWFQSINTSKIETIQPFCVPPWQATPKVVILERELALAQAIAASTQDVASIFTDGSVRNELTGIGIYSAFYRIQHSETTGTREYSTPHSTELQAILRALELVNARQTRQNIRIFSDSHSALKSIARPRHQAGQAILRKIIYMAYGRDISFEWTPGGKNVQGNSNADKLARMATKDDCQPPLNQVAVRSAVGREARNKRLAPTTILFTASRAGSFTRQLDKALPGKHVRLLYNTLPYDLAAILCQMRTAKSRLNSYLARIKVVESNLCLCGAPETIHHFIFECPRWLLERQQIRNINRQRWGDTSFYLGGWTSREIDGDMSKWRPHLEAVRATIAFAKATGRLDYKPNLHFVLHPSQTPSASKSSSDPTIPI
jgi:ribonuclease HI